MADTNFGTFEDLLLLTAEEFQPISSRLRELILEIHPDSVEVVRLGEKSATYGLGPKKMTEGYAYIMPHKNWINLGFFKGALLNDKDIVLEGGGKSLRHIKIHSIEEANREEIKLILQEALEERKTALEK